MLYRSSNPLTSFPTGIEISSIVLGVVPMDTLLDIGLSFWSLDSRFDSFARKNCINECSLAILPSADACCSSSDSLEKSNRASLTVV